MIALCLGLAASIGAVIPAQQFTLAWNHSIEKIRWEEDYQVHAEVLELIEARIRGSGAGMEPPADALLRNGVWHYRPASRIVPRLSLARSAVVADYELCVAGSCRALGDYLDGRFRAATYIEVFPCASR